VLGNVVIGYNAIIGPVALVVRRGGLVAAAENGIADIAEGITAISGGTADTASAVTA